MVTIRKINPGVVLLLLILGAVVVPRVVLFHGISQTNNFDYADMVPHLLKLDHLSKRWRLPPELLEREELAAVPNYLRGTVHWPEGFYLPASLWVGIFGPLSIWTTLLQNLLFLSILLVAVVGLGAALADLRTGLWAALVVALSPPLVAASWYYCHELPMAAMVAVGLLLLYHSRSFSRPAYSLAFGLWAVAGMYIKLSYVLYLLGPSVVALVWARGRYRPRDVLLGLVLASSVTLGLGALLHDTGQLILEIAIHFADRTTPAGHQFPPLSFSWALAYPLLAALNYPLPLLLLALPGVALLHRRPRAAGVLLLGLFWGTLILLTVMANKLERYAMPLYPLLCLASVWWVAQLARPRLRRLGLTLTAGAHAVVLVVAMQIPTPWFWSNAQATWLEGVIELGMPGPARRQQLRRTGTPAECDPHKLKRALHEMARAEGTRRPLGIALPATDTADWLPRLGLDSEKLPLLLAQLDHGRVFYMADIEQHMPRMPLLVVHRLPGDLRALPSHYPVLARRLRLCKGGKLELTMSLLRHRQRQTFLSSQGRFLISYGHGPKRY